MRFSVASANSIAFAAVVALALVGIAVPTAFAEERPLVSRELNLDELMAQMSKTHGVVAGFREQKEIGLLVSPLESGGVLYFAPPGRLARFTLEPSYASMVIDGGTLRYRDGEGGEEFDLSGNPMARIFVDNFIVLFNGDVERLRELYETEFVTEDREWSLTLRPRSQRMRAAIESIVLTGDLDGGGIRRMEMRSADGDRTTTDLETRDTDRRFSAAELELLFTQRIPLPDAPAAE